MEEKRARKKTKKTKKFTLTMQANLLMVFGVVVLLFVALIGRILYLNYSVGDKYEKRVLSQQTYVSNAILYQRGSILDRNGTVLAESIRVYNIIIDCDKLNSEEEYMEPTLAALTDCFGADTNEVRKILADKPKSKYTIFMKSVPQEQVEMYREMAKENKLIQGIWFEDDYKRVYPYNSLACDTIGFSLPGTSTGIESFYNDELVGVNGREYGYFDSDLNLERTVKPAQNGNNIVSTLDANIQQIVEKHIAKFNKDTGSKNTAVLVMNPQNGEIYAMASGKPYDLNNPQDMTSIYSKKKLAKMSDKDKLEALNNLWRNFCVSDGYEPGSTFKPITVATALDEGIVNAKSTFYCPGYHLVAGKTRIGCAARAGHGTITLGESLMYSCNAAMMQIVEKLGKQKFYNYETNFMFGSRTGIDLPAETNGIIFPLDALGDTELATSSFGQSTKVTMLQIASAISSIVNGGNYYEPHVLKQIESSTGAVITNKDPVLVTKTISEDTSKLVRQFLYDTVENGTATAAKVDGYAIGGKTGTAEKYPRGNKKYLVSFIGVAPALDPEVMIYVIVDEPKVKDQAHSTFASNLFHDIAGEIFPFLDIDKTVKSTEKKKDTKKKDTQEAKKEDNEEEKKKQEKHPTIGDESGVTSDEENDVIPEAPKGEIEDIRQ